MGKGRPTHRAFPSCVQPGLWARPCFCPGGGGPSVSSVGLSPAVCPVSAGCAGGGPHTDHNGWSHSALSERCQVGRGPYALASSQGLCQGVSGLSPGGRPSGEPLVLPGNHRAGAGRTSGLMSPLSALSTETSSLTTFCWMSKVSGGWEAPALRM